MIHKQSLEKSLTQQFCNRECHTFFKYPTTPLAANSISSWYQVTINKDYFLCFLQLSMIMLLNYGKNACMWGGTDSRNFLRNSLQLSFALLLLYHLLPIMFEIPCWSLRHNTGNLRAMATPCEWQSSNQPKSLRNSWSTAIRSQTPHTYLV